MRRGSVYWVNLEPASPPEMGKEMGKVRPAVVVSATTHNERIDSVVVVPLSSRPPEIWPLRMRLDLPRRKPSYAVVPAVRQVSKARLHEILGQASSADMARLGEALALYLSD
jgi:mRNA interferase MazF